MTSRKSSKPSTGNASDHLQLATIVLDALTLPYHSLFYHYLRGNTDSLCLFCGYKSRESRPAIKLFLDLAPASSISHAEASGFAPGFNIASGFENPDETGLDLQEMTYTSFVENQYSFGSFTNAEPMETRLTAIGKPLLVNFGAEDQIAVGEANDLSDYRTVPGARVVVLPGVGHSPQVEAPDKTASLILAFIQQK